MTSLILNRVLRYLWDIQVQMFTRQKYAFVRNSGKRSPLEKTMGIVHEGMQMATAEALGLAPWGTLVLRAHRGGSLRRRGQRGKKRLGRAYRGSVQ